MSESNCPTLQEDTEGSQTALQVHQPGPATTAAIPQHLRQFLSRLQGVRPTGNGKWMALCPFHDDQKPSLHVTLGKKGQILFNCFVCKPDKDAKTAKLRELKLTWEDLQPGGCYGYAAMRKRGEVRPESDLAASIAQDEEDRAERAIYGLTEEQASLRNNYYSFLSGGVALSEKHRRQLEGRGLDAATIKANGYFSIENIDAGIREGLRKLLCNTPLGTIPGYTRDGLVPSRGLFIPVRNAEGSILTAQVRVGGPAKYLWLKGSRVIPHVPLGVKPGATVWVTEGPLKADLATFFGYPCVGVPGISTWRTILPCMKRWGTKQVVIAFDADRQRNASVQREFLAFASELKKRGYEVMVATWAESDGNGLDDLLRNGSRPCVEPFDYTNPPFQVTRTGLIRWEDDKAGPAVKTPAGLWQLLNTLDNNMQENIFLTSDALVWLAIFRNGRDGKATVSEETIASQIGLSERTIKRAVAELKRLGLIEVTRGNNLKQTPSDYCLPDALPAGIHAA